MSLFNNSGFKAKRRNAIAKYSYGLNSYKKQALSYNALILGGGSILGNEYDWEYPNDHETRTRKRYGTMLDALRRNDTFDSTVLSMLSREFSTGCILHEAIRAGAPENVLLLLVKRFPIFLTQVDHNGRYPVHVACAFGASSEFVSHCINSASASASAKDVDGKTPIQLLCQGTWQGCWNVKSNTIEEKNMEEILWMLFLESPSSVVSEDCHGVGVIEYAIEFGLGIMFVQTLQEMIGHYKKSQARTDDQP